jgi:hypothetical protein
MPIIEEERMSQEEFTKKELQELMLLLNCFGEPDKPEHCALSIKIERMIEQFPATTQEVIAGHTITREITKK